MVLACVFDLMHRHTEDHAWYVLVKYVQYTKIYPGNDPKMMRSALVFHDISVQLVRKLMLAEDHGSPGRLD